MANSALTTELRLRPRHRLNLELQLSYRRGNCTFLGTGRTKNFGDRVICFESDQDLPGGINLDLCIAWPDCLQGSFPLDLIVHGLLIRKQPGSVAVQIQNFEFRTRGGASFHAPANRGYICDVFA